MVSAVPESKLISVWRSDASGRPDLDSFLTVHPQWVPHKVCIEWASTHSGGFVPHLPSPSWFLWVRFCEKFSGASEPRGGHGRTRLCAVEPSASTQIFSFEPALCASGLRHRPTRRPDTCATKNKTAQPKVADVCSRRVSTRLRHLGHYPSRTALVPDY